MAEFCAGVGGERAHRCVGVTGAGVEGYTRGKPHLPGTSARYALLVGMKYCTAKTASKNTDKALDSLVILAGGGCTAPVFMMLVYLRSLCILPRSLHRAQGRGQLQGVALRSSSRGNEQSCEATVTRCAAGCSKKPLAVAARTF